MAIKVKKIKSVKEAQATSKRGSYVDRLTRAGEDGIVVRFLHEIDEGTIRYNEHFVDSLGFVICEENCKYCEEGISASTRFLVRALDRSTNEVIALVLPKSLMAKLSRRAERRNTIMDSDYEITREGTGYETEYDLEPQDRSKINVSKYDDQEPTVESLIALLEEEAAEVKVRESAPRNDRKRDDDDDDDYDDDDDIDGPPFDVDEDDDEDYKPKKSSRRPASKTTKRPVRKSEEPAPRVIRRPVKRSGR